MKELFLPSKKKQVDKETFMVPPDEMRQRYKEHREPSPAPVPPPPPPELKV